MRSSELMKMPEHDISVWSSAIESVIAHTQDCCVDQAIVLKSTPSTMDEVRELDEVANNYLVVAMSQTAGRGQRGRHWDDGSEKTLPCTFVIDTSQIQVNVLSTLVACAVHETIRRVVPDATRVMIKWPNDIIVREGEYRHDRKIAGILIEQKGNKAHIGIGINCTQHLKDWSPEIHGRAISLSETGVQVSRIDLVCNLIEQMSGWIHQNNPESVQRYFQSHDAMINTLRTFYVGHEQYSGVVKIIEPLECIVIQNDMGSHRLPIAQTQHVRSD